MKKHPQKSDSPDINLARGGGNATAAGVEFQAKLGACMASRLLAERPLDPRLTGKCIRSLRFETEAPVDDILVETEEGWIFFQAKTRLTLSATPRSELAKTVDQFVRQWIECSTGDGSRGWNRPLQPDRDRLVLALGAGAPQSLSADLAQGLAALQTSGSAQLPQSKTAAVRKFKGLIERAWSAVTGKPATTSEIAAILNLITIISYDLEGADQETATEILSQVVDTPGRATMAFSTIAQYCQGLMRERTGCNTLELRRALAALGVPLAAPPAYRTDVEKLRTYSERVRKQLNDYETTELAGEPICIERRCTDAVVDAARIGSLLLVGEPGAGKSAVINASASRLRDEGRDVIELAVDRLAVKSLPELALELGLSHPLRDVLLNWPGDQPAYLFIDALDATRGGENEIVFRTLIADVLSFENRQWHIIASIRTLDLRLGEQFRQLFKGRPPSDEFADPAFPGVAHIHVPPWTPAEFQQLFQRAPTLALAINTGGERLRELALVPFNTRLLADLISGGLASTAFGEIQSQVQLLALYWNHRVEKHGTGAELCIEAAVTQMIGTRSLRARKLDVARPDAAAFDALLRENVLVPVRQDQFVRFRHHLLFDYAASRVCLPADGPCQSASLLTEDKGLGMMLAPALGFALQHLWNEADSGHRAFWRIIIRLAGEPRCDPITRSVAARTAAELPRVAGDAIGLLTEQIKQDDSNRLATVLNHVFGALVVRFEDKQKVPFDPWCELAKQASERVEDTVWPLRKLLYALCEHIESKAHRAQLGHAARKLLAYSLDPSNAVTQLTASAIDFVAVTYASDIEASKQLLRRLFEPGYFQGHADQEIPWLTRRLEPISEVDPDFVVDIYAGAFASSIEDPSQTVLSHSQILSMTSNRRQDYEMSWWHLKEFFPHFLNNYPVHAIRALVRAISGYVARTHPVGQDARAWSIPTSAGSIRLQEDWSHIWAWDIDGVQGDSAHGLINAFVKDLEDRETDVARTMIQEIIERNELGGIWARTLMAASRRAEAIGDLLWPIATQEPFLTSSDTRKDAIDFIAARYPFEDATAREAFERAAMGFIFGLARQPEEARQKFLLTLFSSIGKQNLATPEAHALLAENEAASSSAPHNERPFHITSGSGSPDRWWWLKRDGVDLDAPDVVQILTATEQIKKKLGLESQAGEMVETGAAIDHVENLVDMTASGVQSLPGSVSAYGVAAQGAAKLSRLPVERLREQDCTLQSLIALVIRLAETPVEPVDAEAEERFEVSTSWGSPNAHVDTAEALMQLCRVGGDVVEKMLPTMKMLLCMQIPAARMQIAERLTVFWNSDRALMWELADRVARRELNRGVLRAFANSFLCRTIHADPDRVEQLTFILHERNFDRADKATKLLGEEIGSLIALLWITHGRPKPQETLQRWIADPHTFEAELSHAISTSGGALVFNHEEENTTDAEITRRAQEFYVWAAGSMADGLKHYLDEAKQRQPTEAEKEHATLYAKFLNQLCDQVYFAAGAFRSGVPDKSPLESYEAKRVFFSEMHPVLARIADAGTPDTIYHLIELLDFLVPADPAAVFDLVAHALLGAGHRFSYQYESLGADRFVEVVGHYLADHRDLFVDETRRRKLVACLNLFMEAGWPIARRLLYRLPELIQ